MHIAKSADAGTTSNINHTLTYLYYADKPLRLQVFKVKSSHTSKDIEKALLNAHLKFFAANPVGQGSTGKEKTHEGLMSYF
jgi:hypothetical protein